MNSISAGFPSFSTGYQSPPRPPPPVALRSERVTRRLPLLVYYDYYRSHCPRDRVRSTSRQIGIDPYCYMEWALQRSVPHPDNRGLVA